MTIINSRTVPGLLLILVLAIVYVQPSLAQEEDGCHSSCLTCSGSRENECLTCNKGSYLAETGHCIDQCEEPLISQVTRDHVEICYSPCELDVYIYTDGSCSLSCEDPLQIKPIGGYNLCVSLCNDDEFWDADTKQCYKCHSSCLTCSGKDENQCLSCTNPEHFIAETGLCLETCDYPLVQGVNDEGAKTCESTCQLTSFIYDDQSCALFCDDRLEVEEYGGYKFCTSPLLCSDGEFWDDEAKKCYECHSSCLTCSGKEENQCLSCTNPDFFVAETGLCLEKCDYPLVQGANDEGVKTCESTCQLTSFINDDQSCALSCDAPLEMKEYGGYKFCTSPSFCSDGEFWDADTKQCYKCHSSCLTCSGKDENQCLSCTNPDYFVAGTGLCIENCDYPLVQGFNNKGVKTCESTCQLTSFINDDQSCALSCDAPSKVKEYGGYKFCAAPPCSDTEYWNPEKKECTLECRFPWVVSDTEGYKTCNKPCGAEEWYEMETGSCFEKCSLPLRADVFGGVAICKKPCNGNKYWWEENGFCVDKCPTLWVEDTNEDGINRCLKRCGKGEIWSEQEDKCVGSCGYGWSVGETNGVLFCKKPCRDGEYWWKNEFCLQECPYPWKAGTDESGTGTCVKPCEEEEVWLDGSCLTDCPRGWLIDEINEVYYCRKPCENGYWWEEGDSCVQHCPELWMSEVDEYNVQTCYLPCVEGEVWSKEQKQCVEGCPDGWSVERANYVDYCKKPCDKGFYWMSEENKCLEVCPDLWLTANDANDVEICVKPCDGNEFWSLKDGECLDSCPEGSSVSYENEVLYCRELDN